MAAAGVAVSANESTANAVSAMSVILRLVAPRVAAATPSMIAIRDIVPPSGAGTVARDAAPAPKKHGEIGLKSA